MAVRAFSGTSWIRFPNINVGGDYTFAALVKMMDTTVPSGWQALASSVDSSTHSQVTHYVRGTVGSTAPQQGTPLVDITQAATGITGVTKAITNPATWKILVVTKTTGATVPRFHVFPIGGAWTQEAGDAAVIGPATQSGGKFYVGAYADPSSAALGDFCNMRLALYAVWNGTALSDAQVQALSSGLATSAWTGHAVAPTSVWQFAQASTATAVTDLVGSNTQDSITGTSVVTTDDPAGWTFAGAGTDATVTGVPADGTGDIPIPAVTTTGDATVTSVPADGTGDIPSPTVAAGANVTAPAADGTGTMPLAGNEVSSEVAAPPAQGTGDLPTPAVGSTADATVTSVPADATGDIPTPTVAAGATVTDVPADGTGDVPAPTLTASSTVTGVPADGTGDLPTPTQVGPPLDPPPDTHPNLGGNVNESPTSGTITTLTRGGTPVTPSRGGIIITQTRGGTPREHPRGGAPAQPSRGGTYDQTPTGGVVL